MARYKTRNLEEQRPFLLEIVSQLRGVPKKDAYGNQVYKCICPNCYKDESNFFTARNGDTFIFKCHREKCGIGSMSLHKVVMKYGSPDIQKKWMGKEDEWFGIKNRVNPGPKKKKSFKESMQLKSECHLLMVTSDSQIIKRPTSDATEPTGSGNTRRDASDPVTGDSGRGIRSL